MCKFYIAGCFADNIIINRDKDEIEMREGGPAHYIKNAFDELGEEYEIAKGKKGIMEIHIQNGEEAGRFPLACRMPNSPISSEIVLAYPILGEVSLDRLKGEFKHIYADSRGFVRDPENFGGKRNWVVKNVERVKVLKTTPVEMKYVPENLLSHVRKNGVLLVYKGGKVSVTENGNEVEYAAEKCEASESIGCRETFFAAFSSEYSKSNDAKKAVEFAIEYIKKFRTKKKE